MTAFAVAQESCSGVGRQFEVVWDDFDARAGEQHGEPVPGLFGARAAGEDHAGFKMADGRYEAGVGSGDDPDERVGFGLAAQDGDQRGAVDDDQ